MGKKNFPFFTFNNYVKNYAFSLAETLTTLMIVGAVSAMMIPIGNNIVTNQKNVAILKRMYSDFSVNIQTVLNHANCSSVSCLRKYGKNRSADPNLRNLHNGAFADAEIVKLNGECRDCFKKNSIMPLEMEAIRDEYEKIGTNPDGSDKTRPTGHDLPANFSAYKYENASIIAIFDYQGNCTTENKVYFTGKEWVCPPAGGPCKWVNVKNESKAVCGMVVFDVNAEKAPNIPGKDRFGFFIMDEPLGDSYLVPMGYSYNDNEKNKSPFNKDGSIRSEVAGNKCKPDDKNGQGYNCTAKVMLNNWKINY